MVNLRYHLVSLAAVLMALAAGVVLGAGPLAQAVGGTVHPSTSPSTEPSAQAAALTQVQAALRFDESVATAMSVKAVKGTLTGTRVVIVVAPGATAATNNVVTAVGTLLQAAGATVGGQVQLSAQWVDPAQSTVLVGITDQLAPTDTRTGDGTPASSAASALAAALLATKASQVGQTSDAATALLAGLEQGGFLTAKGEPARASSLAVLVGTGRPGEGAGLLPLAKALAAAGTGSVTVGPRGTATGAGLVAALRADAAARATISTVDCVDLATGRVAAVLALARDHAGKHGQFGLGPGADAPLPPG